MSYEIHTVTLANGARLGIAARPSQQDLPILQAWAPDAVLSMLPNEEMHGLDLAATFGAKWHHLPITDFGAPNPEIQQLWHALSPKLHDILDAKGAVFAHCVAGRGRSGLILLRLMVERGQNPDAALQALRAIRPGAVETEAQRKWAVTLDQAP